MTRIEDRIAALERTVDWLDDQNRDRDSENWQLRQRVQQLEDDVLRLTAGVDSVATEIAYLEERVP